jgi:type IV secretory pathway VirB10-like protein
MSGLFSSKSPAPPPIPPVPPPAPIKDPSTAVEDEVRADLKRRKGRTSTIATSGSGLTTEAEVSKTSLLGSK